MHYQESVAHFGDLAQHVGADDDGAFGAQVFDQFLDFFALIGVQTFGWFIENEDFGVAEHGLG